MRSFELKIFALLVFLLGAGPTAHAQSAKMFKLTANGDPALRRQRSGVRIPSGAP